MQQNGPQFIEEFFGSRASRRRDRKFPRDRFS
jgi:hypothetical protein